MGYKFTGALLMSALAAGSIGLIALPASGATATPFQLTGFYQVVADNAHGHLFISPGNVTGTGANTIIVTDPAGQRLATITGQTGVSGMALSAGGSTLYAALGGADAVSAISTSTLAETARYDLGGHSPNGLGGHSPTDVAVENGKIWVGYSDEDGTHGPGGYIGEIDPAASSDQFTAEALPGYWQSAPRIAVDPLGGGTLVASDSGLSTDLVGSYNVSTTPVTVNSQPTGTPGCGHENGIAVVPGGGSFLMACNLVNGKSATSLVQVNSTTMAVQGTPYPSGGSAPNSVSVAPSGAVALSIQKAGKAILVYKQGATAPVNAFQLSTRSSIVPATRGLAWAADGSRLFAVMADSSVSPPAYSVGALTRPTVTASALSLTGATSAALGRSVTFSGRLTLTVGNPPAGTKITITRTPVGSTSAKTFSVRLASDYTYKLTDTPPGLGTYTYTARYSGDTARQPATATRRLTITKIPVTLTLRASAGTVNYGTKITLTAHLGTTYQNRTVSIWAKPFGSTTPKLIKTGRVNSSRNLNVTYPAPRSTAFSATFGGDARYAAKAVTVNVYVRAKVSESISGYFRSTTIGGVPYRVYHKSGTLKLTVTVTPNKAGQCGSATFQVYFQGRWRLLGTTGCGALNKSSQISGAFPMDGLAGYRFRVQAEYIRSSKDTSNLSNHSGWLYFQVVK